MPYIIAIVLLIIGGVAYYFMQETGTVATTPEPTPITQEAPAPTTTGNTDTPTQAPAEAQNADTDYKDGTYDTDVTYFTPKRDEYGVNVSLTLTKDIVTGATVTYSDGAENDPNAAKFQAAYKAQVIGKDIDTLNLARVGGASLTTAAFNNALVDIKADAKS